MASASLLVAPVPAVRPTPCIVAASRRHNLEELHSCTDSRINAGRHAYHLFPTHPLSLAVATSLRCKVPHTSATHSTCYVAFHLFAPAAGIAELILQVSCFPPSPPPRTRGGSAWQPEAHLSLDPTSDHPMQLAETLMASAHPATLGWRMRGIKNG